MAVDPFASVWDDASLALQRRLLRRVTEIAALIGVALYLDSGTLLGHVRLGGILPWDDDLDLALPDGARALELGAAIAASGLQCRFVGSETFMKVYDPSYPNPRGLPWTWPFIDIFVFHPQGDALMGSYPTLTMPRDFILPGRRATFEDASCWEPEKPLAVLDQLYPGWRVREATPTWNHREDRFAESIASRAVRTNATGRKIDHDPAVMRVPRWIRSRRPCLVVIRASGEARYKAWMRPDAIRSWDLLVNDPDDRAAADDVADIVAIGGTGKYPAAKELYYTDASILRQRKAVLFLDDDIDLAFEDLDRLFQTFVTCGLWLAQPAWAPGSPATARLTQSDPRFEAHYTNFVDGAASLFSQSALAVCIESFDQPPGTTELELGFLWPELLAAPFDRVAVIDAVTVRPARGTSGRAAEVVNHGARLLGYVARSSEGLQKFTVTT